MATHDQTATFGDLEVGDHFRLPSGRHVFIVEHSRTDGETTYLRCMHELGEGFTELGFHKDTTVFMVEG